jgi:hypothetical protein
MVTAAQYIRTGMAKHVLVIGADAMSRLVDWRDRGEQHRHMVLALDLFHVHGKHIHVHGEPVHIHGKAISRHGQQAVHMQPHTRLHKGNISVPSQLCPQASCVAARKLTAGCLPSYLHHRAEGVNTKAALGCQPLPCAIAALCVIALSP